MMITVPFPKQSMPAHARLSFLMRSIVVPSSPQRPTTENAICSMVLSSLMLYFVKMDIAKQDAVPTDGALADVVEVAAKYGFSVVPALAAARNQRHIVTEAFSDLIV